MVRVWQEEEKENVSLFVRMEQTGPTILQALIVNSDGSRVWRGNLFYIHLRKGVLIRNPSVDSQNAERAGILLGKGNKIVEKDND